MGWVGLGQSADGLGWIESHEMDPRTTLPQTQPDIPMYIANFPWLDLGAHLHCNTKIIRSTQVHNGISIGSAVSAGLTNVSIRQTESPTDQKTMLHL